MLTPSQKQLLIQATLDAQGFRSGRTCVHREGVLEPECVLGQLWVLDGRPVASAPLCPRSWHFPDYPPALIQNLRQIWDSSTWDSHDLTEDEARMAMLFEIELADSEAYPV